MSKYCSSCGTTNSDSSTNCVNCGAVLDNYNNVYPAGRQPYGQQPYGQPYAQTQAYSVPNSMPYAPPTSTIGWIGWMLLCTLLPVIGQLIMLTSKDQSTKNFAKAQLILTLISVILAIILFVVLGYSFENYVQVFQQN
ncbi:hypothetical protein [Ruminococcus sp.]|uniref:hypothetical protein n=1 Tax=Ruminococcus sp. TaxID=41978 RepID=UPI0025F1C577|nr:hypothetical protein [Ruminococcus sp.]MBQ8965309.1 hypothetical protein [Ruminococcus sp.]